MCKLDTKAKRKSVFKQRSFRTRKGNLSVYGLTGTESACRACVALVKATGVAVNQGPYLAAVRRACTTTAFDTWVFGRPSQL